MEKTGLIELRFNVLFPVCIDKTNNGSHTVLPKDMTETDSGKQVQDETLNSLPLSSSGDTQGPALIVQRRRPVWPASLQYM